MAGETGHPGLAIRDGNFPAAGDQLFDDGTGMLDDGIARVNWALPWSDLMMTMFVLFAALLAAHALNNGAQGPGLNHETPPQVQQQVIELEKTVPEPAPDRSVASDAPVPADVLAGSRNAVQEANLQNAEVVLLEDQSVKVSAQGPMFFAAGKANLQPEVEKFLDRFAQVIKATPYDVHVIGHTDDKPINTAAFPSNWELSLVRASRVARYLIKAGNLDPARFLVTGRGEYDPAATNADDESRALNRRVEIIITRNVGKHEEKRQ